jgi:hypothetical protein
LLFGFFLAMTAAAFAAPLAEPSLEEAAKATFPVIAMVSTASFLASAFFVALALLGGFLALIAIPRATGLIRLTVFGLASQDGWSDGCSQSDRSGTREQAFEHQSSGRSFHGRNLLG